MEFNIEVDYIAKDLSQINAANEVFELTKARNYNIDTLINNAGFANYGEHITINLSDNHKLLQLNIIALTEMCALFASPMKTRKSGKILNVSSVAAYQPTPYIAAYGASKSYVLFFSEALAKELEDYNVSVTCLSPGATESNFFKVAKMEENQPQLFKKKMSAQKVARIGIEAMKKGKMTVIPGFKNQFLSFTNRFAPRTMVAAISKRLMRK